MAEGARDPSHGLRLPTRPVLTVVEKKRLLITTDTITYLLMVTDTVETKGY